MSAAETEPRRQKDIASHFLVSVSLTIVVLGLANTMARHSGPRSRNKRIGWTRLVVDPKFPIEWFYPIAFSLMMLCVALKHSIWRGWRGRSPRGAGLAAMDVALVVAAFSISLTYMIEIESICLIDQITGERARLIAEALKNDKALAVSLGLPEPLTVDDPSCVATTGGWLVAIVCLSIVVFLAYNTKVWGLPIVIVALVVAMYTIGTVLVWYFHGPEDINKYLMTKLGGEPWMLVDGRPKVHDILVNNASGILGRFMNIMLDTIFPYLVLGSLLEPQQAGNPSSNWHFGGRGVWQVAQRTRRSSPRQSHDIWRTHRQRAVHRCSNDSDDA